MKTLILAISLSAAIAVAPAALSAAEETDPPVKKQKKICRSYKVTGSLTRVQRICRTEQDWKDADAATKKGVDKMQGSASGAPRCVGLDSTCVG